MDRPIARPHAAQRRSLAQGRSRSLALAVRSVLVLAMLVLATLGSSGCSWLSGDGAARYRADNERLIHDYRAARDRAERSELQNRALLSRISELETRLATHPKAIDSPIASAANTSLPETATPRAPAPALSRPPYLPASQSLPLDPWRAASRP